MRKILAKIDIPLAILTIIYIVLGLIMVYSASSVTAVVRYGFDPGYFFIRQAIFVIAALLLGIVVLFLPTKYYNVISKILVIVLIISLVYVLFYGKIANGSRSWIDLKFFSIQPSEFAKSILIIYYATFFYQLSKKSKKNIGDFFYPLTITVIVATLVILQPDLGSDLIIIAICGLMLVVIPDVQKNWRSFLKLLGIGIVIIAIIYLAMGDKIASHIQASRFNFTNPCSRYTESSGYQVCNGFIAINNGGWFGVGLGNSTQKYLYLPEAHTDFIFPIIVEELGLVVGILIIIGYAIMLYRIFRIAKKSENLRCSIMAWGTFCYLGLHIIINLFGILALMPLTGVPLPLLSYGGSFTFNAIVMLILMQRINYENNVNKTNREIKSL